MGRKFALALLTVAGLVWTLSAAAEPPAEFTRQTAWTGLTYPTALALASNGHAFIANQRGDIRASEGFGQPTQLLEDMRGDVHDYWDRGLLGLAVHPEYPALPYLYALHAYGVPLDDRLPIRGDGCPDPPGGTADGCVVSGRLVRLTVDPTTFTVVDKVEMLHDWCQQFPSHSIADVTFGPDGALYVSGGDGASFNDVDYGQFGGTRPGTPTPANPCDDPPGGFGAALSAPTAEGGALRSQDLRTAGDPVSASGTVLRVNPLYDPDDPSSSLALPDNPNIGHPDPIGKLVVAYGLRNPYRIAFDPDGNLYIGDVGWNLWEEVNLHPDPTASVHNFGWPCYEGSSKQGGYAGANLNICQDLYDDEAAHPGTVSFPLYAYHHNDPITNPTTPDNCPPAAPPAWTSSAITGLALYTTGNYPGEYAGALFGADYSRDCIWVMRAGVNGVPDPSTIEVFDFGDEIRPVDIEVGHDGDIYFVSRDRHTVFRYLWTGQNHPPVAVIDASTLSGDAPLDVTLDGTGSHDPDGHEIVKYEWDLDGDGVFETEDPVVAHTFGPGSHTVRLRVTDFPGLTSEVVSVRIDASNVPPTVEITSPSPSLTWVVDQHIEYSAAASDPSEGPLPEDRYQWELIIHHCTSDISCHEHLVWTREGHSSGALDAPDHGYPSHLELRVTVRDQYDVEATDSVLIHPESVLITVESQPSGVPLTAVDRTEESPWSLRVIVGSRNLISAPETHENAEGDWRFVGWLHGGERTQTIHAPASDTTYTAVYGTTREFLDAEGHLFEGDIEWLAARGITRGCNPPVNDLVCPDAVVTRGQMAAFFVRALGLSVGAGSDLFDDDNRHLFEHEIDLLATAGITRGCNPPANTRFCPDDYVTRGQMAAFFVRALGLPVGAYDLFDDDDGHLFEAEIDRLASADITRGCNPPTNDRFCPDDYVTRGQMAAFFHRAVDWLP